MKLHRSAFPLQIKADEAKPGKITGYGSVFGNEDSYGDIVAPGAFKASIERHMEAKTMPAMLWQHNTDWPIGKWVSMTEDERGLVMEGEFNLKTSRGVDAYEHAKAGDISGLSIGFMTKGYEWDEEGGQRTLTELDLWEVSLVTFPANTLARLTDTKSQEEIDAMSVGDIERELREAGFTREGAKRRCYRLQQLGALREAERIKAELRTEQAIQSLMKRFGR